MSETVKLEVGTDELLAEVRGRVGVVTLNRPEARNAFTSQLIPILGKLVSRLDEDPNVGSILVTGAGTAFCAVLMRSERKYSASSIEWWRTQTYTMPPSI